MNKKVGKYNDVPLRRKSRENVKHRHHEMLKMNRTSFKLCNNQMMKGKGIKTGSIQSNCNWKKFSRNISS